MQLDLFDSDKNKKSDLCETHHINGLVYFKDLLSRDRQIEILEKIDSEPWMLDLKRRVQHYGYRYNYKARKVNYEMKIGELPEFAVEVGNLLVKKNLIETPPDQLIVNEYQPGQGITAHIDCQPCFKNAITTVSLGSEYDMDFVRVSDGKVVSKTLESGSALVMKDESRYDWMHRINARKSDPSIDGKKKRLRGRRVSLTFRNVIIS